MTKEEFVKKLTAAVGGTTYGDEIIADLSEHFDETGKYAQTAKDRLDERIATLTGWEKKHRENGEVAKATEEAAKIEIAKMALAAIQ